MLLDIFFIINPPKRGGYNKICIIAIFKGELKNFCTNTIVVICMCSGKENKAIKGEVPKEKTRYLGHGASK